jgi:alkylhydroperoxidase family enzyme
MENGLTEEKISQLDADANEFSNRERLAVDYAEQLATNHHAIDDDYFATLAGEFDDAEILELGMMIGQYIGFGRLLKVLDLEPTSCPVEDE